MKKLVVILFSALLFLVIILLGTFWYLQKGGNNKGGSGQDSGSVQIDISDFTQLSSESSKQQSITFETKSDYGNVELKLKDRNLFENYIKEKGILDNLATKGALDLNTDTVNTPEKIIIVLTPEEQPLFKHFAQDREDKVLVKSFGGGFIEGGRNYELKVYINEKIWKSITSDIKVDRIVSGYILEGLYFISSSDKLADEIADGFQIIEKEITERDLEIFEIEKKSLLNIFLDILVKDVNAQVCRGSPRGCSISVTYILCPDPNGSCFGRDAGQRCNDDPYNPAFCAVSTVCIGTYARACTVSGMGVCQALPCNPTYTCSPPEEVPPSCYWSGDPTPTPMPDPGGNGGEPSCTVSLDPSTASVSEGSDVNYIATVTVENGSVIQVDFFSSNTSVAAVNPALDASQPYQTAAETLTVGSTNIIADVVMVEGTVTCTDSATLNVTDPDPWWQVIDSDIITNGDIISSIPLSCALDDCNPLFGLEGLGGFPGVPIYGGSADFGEGDISSTDWLANTQSLFSKIYDYNYFSRLVRSDVVLIEFESNSVNGGFFTSGGVDSRGYVWYHFDGATLGDLTITDDMNIILDRKVVLLVEGADLYINGRITLQKEGEGFFMVIVGKDANGNKGNIFVNASVVHDTKPELQGVFLAEGQFRTGAGDEQLHIRGMVAAYDGIVLERDLQGDNATEPAEVFEFAPDFVLTFPRDLTFKRLRWKEVAP